MTNCQTGLPRSHSSFWQHFCSPLALVSIDIQWSQRDQSIRDKGWEFVEFFGGSCSLVPLVLHCSSWMILKITWNESIVLNSSLSAQTVLGRR